jgi:acyl carrier protein
MSTQPAEASSLRSVLAILDGSLGLRGRTAAFTRSTYLLGEQPEMDSLAVVRLIMQLQETLGLEFTDDELDGSVFATVGSLVDFVDQKLAATVAP